MRVTNHHATQQAIATFSTTRGAMDAALERATTGRRMRAASDDPTSALTVMQNETQSRAIGQYQRNIQAATARLSLEGDTLESLTSLLTRAKELAMGQAGDTATPTTRQASAAEANQLLAQAIQLANTKHAGEYLFGGYTSTTAPYTVNTAGAVYSFTVAATPPTGTRDVEVASGQLVTTSHDGTTVFGTATAGPLAALEALATALNSGSGANVTAALPGLDTALQNTQVFASENGARMNQIENAAATYSALAIQLEAGTSAIRDIDIEEALTELAGRQTAFQAAMAATARVLGMSLTDYLR